MSVTSSGSARTILSLGLLATLAGSLIYVFTREQDEAEIAAGTATAPVAANPAAPVAATRDAETAAEDAVEDVPAAASGGTEAAEAPSIDVLRVQPDGAAVVAGRAAPGSTVTVYAEEEKIAEAEADAQGNFVAIFDAEPSAEPRALTLGSETAEGEKAVSDQVVLLLPEAPAPAESAAEETEEVVAVEETEEVAAAAEAAAAPGVAATAILSPDRVEITPLARPTGAAANRVSLASISYADKGEVNLAGFGLAGAPLRAYVDDTFALDGVVDSEGRWSIALGGVAAGIYRLRIDQLGSDGKVSSRVETPFQRDFPRARPASDAGAPRVSLVVQPGNNLWTLARIHYGAGVLYTQIFTANSDLIGDPDLIYPGQIFRLPEKPADE